MVVIFFMAVSALKSALDRPTVYTSWETQECVRAEDVKGNPIDCSQVPERYRNVWVP